MKSGEKAPWLKEGNCVSTRRDAFFYQGEGRVEEGRKKGLLKQIG